MRYEINLLRGAIVALALVTIGVVISCGGAGSAIAVQPPGIPTLYGDGSAGALNVTVDTVLADVNTQYTSISITGVFTTLTVPSGTVLRCTGTCTVGAGAGIEVELGALGGEVQDDAEIAAGTVLPRIRSAAQGVSNSAAGVPEIGDTTSVLTGGAKGLGLGSASRFLRVPGHSAGGSGMGGCGGTGGSGGGGLTILAFGAISVAGNIDASGFDTVAGSGGGAGGVVVLASATSIQTDGAVDASGGSGGFSVSDGGAGGGGGGGIINLLAPSIGGVDGVNYVVPGGAPGVPGVAATDAFRCGGGGGGACGGDGGDGGSVNAADAPGSASAGSPGNINRIVVADPAGLFP